eukprot:gene8950-biopygen9156
MTLCPRSSSSLCRPLRPTICFTVQPLHKHSDTIILYQSVSQSVGSQAKYL